MLWSSIGEAQRVQKLFFLWWPQMDQADLHILWEMKGRGKAGRKVREREGEQPQRCGCSSSSCFTGLLAKSEEA